MHTSNPDLIPEIIEILRSNNRVTVLTGAGISAESGVPTFRDAQTGLWSKFQPTELATPQAFRQNPKLVWEWYTWRREIIKKALPNPALFALAEMEKLFPEFVLITQNVDRLHRIAGNERIIELHGDIFKTKCSVENIAVKDWPDKGDIPPLCPHCGGMLRPDVVWFGESLPARILEAAWEAASSCQVFLAIGTSSVVEPAASLPIVALHNSAVVIEINSQDTPLSGIANYSLKGAAGDILPRLVSGLNR